MNLLCDVIAQFYVSHVPNVISWLFSPLGTETLVLLYTVNAVSERGRDRHDITVLVVQFVVKSLKKERP